MIKKSKNLIKRPIIYSYLPHSGLFDLVLYDRDVITNIEKVIHTTDVQAKLCQNVMT